MANCQQFGGDFEFEGASQGNISEISFPSHVSGLESFSDFDKSFQGFQDERSSSQTAAPAKILGILLLIFHTSHSTLHHNCRWDLDDLHEKY